MRHTLPLDEMTVEEKLQAMEDIWDNLQNNDENVPTPTWHEDVLSARKRRVKEETATFNDWESAKEKRLK